MKPDGRRKPLPKPKPPPSPLCKDCPVKNCTVPPGAMEECRYWGESIGKE